MTGRDVTAVVVAWNSQDDLPACLASLAGVAEMLVVDNASRDASAEKARSQGARVISNAENRGFGAAVNQALREARTPLVLLLNPDAVLSPGALDALVAVLDADPTVAIAGPRTRNTDGTIQLSFGPDLTPASERRQQRLVRGIGRRDASVLEEVEALASRGGERDWVSGSCWLARRDELLEAGGFDEAYFLYEEDADLCRRVRGRGFKVVFVPGAEAVHASGRSASQSAGLARREYDRSHLRYYRKWNGALLAFALRVKQAFARG
jgi:GT2 family glycosyltransferase